jgi:hypothetical protein
MHRQRKKRFAIKVITTSNDHFYEQVEAPGLATALRQAKRNVESKGETVLTARPFRP